MFYVIDNLKNKVVGCYTTDLAAQNHCISTRYCRIVTKDGREGTDKANKEDLKIIGEFEKR